MKQLFWLVSPLNPFALTPLNMDEVTLVEEKLGVSLPKDYLEVLMMQNGGYLTETEFSVQDNVFSCEYLFGVCNRQKEGVLVTQLLVKEWQLPGNLVALSGEGSRWFVLDYRDNKVEPSISFLDLESGIDMSLAENFCDFIEQLKPSELDTNDEHLPTASASYTFAELEGYVTAGNDAFKITDAFLFYMAAPCDLGWLLQQCEKALQLDNELIGPEVLFYVWKKLQQLSFTPSDKEQLNVFATSLATHPQADVKKYNQMIKKLIQ